MTVPENTAGRQEARKALAETRRSKSRTASVIAEANRQIAALITVREENHFTEGVKKMLRGTA